MHKVEAIQTIGEYKLVVVFGEMGHRCGYVGVKPSHPLFGVTYQDLEDHIDGYLEVHGGLTYSGESDRYPTLQVEKVWWFGFDCAHLYDGKDLELAKHYFMSFSYMKTYGALKQFDRSDEQVKSLEYCIYECIHMIDQLNRRRE
jgi:hypothetical protein